MLTINSYNKETLDRSSITIVDRYKSIVNEKVNDINDVRALTMMLYQTIYYYLDDAKETLGQLMEIVDSWESETGIDTTPIRDEIKHTESMVEAVEEITDDNYGGSDDDDGDDDGDEEIIEEKVESVESETEEVVEVIKENPEVKEGIKEGVKEEARTELPTTTTPSVPTTPENARQEAADSIRSRADDGREFTYEQDPRSTFDTIIDILTGNLPTSDHVEDTAHGARADALDAAATVIENGGTAREAVDAYLENINPPTEEDGYINAPNTYSPTDETSDVINQDIQDIIDAANEAAESESGGSGGSDTPSCDEPSCDTPCDCCDNDCCDADCDCCDSDSCDDSCCDSDCCDADCDCCDGDCDIPVCDTPTIDVDDI